MALPSYAIFLGRLRGATGPRGANGTRGPEGPKGPQGPAGLPGTGAVPSDEFIGSAVASTGTHSQTAVDGRVDALAGPAAVLNPETEQHDAVTEVAGQAIASATNVLVPVDAVGNPGMPRPAVAGKVAWLLSTTDAMPVNAVDGDMVFRVSSTPQAWTPRQIPGCVGWWDASYLPHDEGEPVTVWPNLIGQYPGATAIDGEATFRTGGLAGAPSVQFNGSSGTLLASGFPASAEPVTVYAVIQHTGATVSGTDFAWDATTGSSPIKTAFAKNASLQWQAYMNNAGANVVSPGAGTGIRVVKVRYDATEVSISLDGVQVATAAGGSQSLLTAISLGGRADGAAANVWNGHIGAVVYVRGDTTIYDDAAVYAHLNTRFGTSAVADIDWSDVPGVVVALDAQDITGVTTGQTLPVWQNSASGAGNAVQPTSGWAPTYASGALNGHPCVTSDGIDDRMTIDLDAEYTGSWTVYAVVGNTPSDVSGHSHFLLDSVPRSRVSVYRTTEEALRLQSGGAVIAGAGGTWPDGKRIIKAVFASDGSASVDGNRVGAGPLVPNAVESLVLFARGDEDPGYGFAGALGVLLVIQGVVDSITDQIIMGKLAADWG